MGTFIPGSEYSGYTHTSAASLPSPCSFLVTVGLAFLIVVIAYYFFDSVDIGYPVHNAHEGTDDADKSPGDDAPVNGSADHDEPRDIPLELKQSPQQRLAESSQAPINFTSGDSTSKANGNNGDSGEHTELGTGTTGEEHATASGEQEGVAQEVGEQAEAETVTALLEEHANEIHGAEEEDLDTLSTETQASDGDKPATEAELWLVMALGGLGGSNSPPKASSEFPKRENVRS
jgi:hypothetical protein